MVHAMARCWRRRLGVVAGTMCLLSSCVLDRGGLFLGGGAMGDAGAGGSSSDGGGPAQGGNSGQSVGGGGGDGGVMGSGGAGMGGQPPAPECGNGIIEPDEECDDGNVSAKDGCDGDCKVEPGFTCDEEPSDCSPIEPIAYTVANIAQGIPDNAVYDGTLATMACAQVVVPQTAFQSLQSVRVTVAIDHPYLGDLVLKLVSPNNTVVTLMSRPGAADPADASFETPNGDSSDLVSTHPVSFYDGAPHDAESMGQDAGGNDAACRDDGGRCHYYPSSEHGPGVAMSDFDGEDPAGSWQLCTADGDDNDAGTITAVTLDLLVW